MRRGLPHRGMLLWPASPGPSTASFTGFRQAVRTTFSLGQHASKPMRVKASSGATEMARRLGLGSAFRIFLETHRCQETGQSCATLSSSGVHQLQPLRVVNSFSDDLSDVLVQYGHPSTNMSGPPEPRMTGPTACDRGQMCPACVRQKNGRTFEGATAAPRSDENSTDPRTPVGECPRTGPYVKQKGRIPVSPSFMVE